jgi:hypothetical protein
MKYGSKCTAVIRSYLSEYLQAEKVFLENPDQVKTK